MPDDAPRTTAPNTPGDEWTRLLADAARHAADRPLGIAEHRPRVAVLSCSDARVPPSIVFGRPAGELFVVRIAGNTASPTAVASLDYAVDHLGVELIVVLGHTECGAVGAAIAGSHDDSLSPVVSPIREIVVRHPDADHLEVARLNVETTTQQLVAASAKIAAAVAAGRLTLHGAIYDLESGELSGIDARAADRFTPPSIPHCQEAS